MSVCSLCGCGQLQGFEWGCLSHCYVVAAAEPRWGELVRAAARVIPDPSEVPIPFNLLEAAAASSDHTGANWLEPDWSAALERLAMLPYVWSQDHVWSQDLTTGWVWRWR